MTVEMLESEAEWLPQFNDKKPRPTPVIHIPANVKRAEALAINARFGLL